MSEAILELRDITCYLEKGTNVFSNITFSVNDGDILVLQGRSGSGKSTLLKCIAHLAMHTGDTLYRGIKPQAYGIPSYRTKVMYVPQRPSLLPGSPYDFLVSVTNLRSHKAPNSEGLLRDVFKQAVDIGEQWGIQRELWHRGWQNVSGGEAQRILLAAAMSFDTAEILLLDEPTSALDAETSQLVEKYLVERVQTRDTNLKALLWITHSPEQSRRVGTRFIHLSGGSCYETEDPSPSPYPTTPVG
ncbi:P-loop containing nucleoside triphosphate hydrolase protein [Gymnopilus junonius]|uniref:P-loop containing nucleoside triphosphate hydrolase protein n=1 Tax=Gymnopilus junonius TaxID=109634 RepID=A0A9P5TTH8_GYMJU|nr:P-loop containing nucleoside triphosphate hydrolase protein [Gymnopilus junonius]